MSRVTKLEDMVSELRANLNSLSRRHVEHVCDDHTPTTPMVWVPSADSHSARVDVSDVLTLIMEHLGLVYDQSDRLVEKKDE
jgi:hypothetical protein